MNTVYSYRTGATQPRFYAATTKFIKEWLAATQPRGYEDVLL